ncbi:MAG TPA: DegT/DnrJ/EryC1/StrS family aminotransferase [Armatimonadota bacterium]|jgi:dTDP-4-amino-4,6-dideoxygalactose transaminase
MSLEAHWGLGSRSRDGEGARNQSPAARDLLLWSAAEYPDYSHHYLARSGSTLLHEALRQSRVTTVVLPAFICPSVSQAAASAGKRLVHVDVDPTTLMPAPDALEECLSHAEPERTAVLLDHSFGYPLPYLGQIQSWLPGVTVIEDAVRALGARANGRTVGHLGDQVLLSLHKTTPGNDHGALLLTQGLLSLREGPRAPVTPRQRLSVVPVVRWGYERLRRRSPDLSSAPEGQQCPPWAPIHGMPNDLSLRRFLHTQVRPVSARALRRQAHQELFEALAPLSELSLVRTAEGCENAGHFLSFTLEEGVSRLGLMASLHRQGFFLLRTWDLVPASFRSLEGTFPLGAGGSLHLSRHLVHVPMWQYLPAPRRQRFVAALKRALVSARR